MLGHAAGGRDLLRIAHFVMAITYAWPRLAVSPIMKGGLDCIQAPAVRTYAKPGTCLALQRGFLFCVSEAWAMKQVALCSRPMPTHSRRRSPPATRRRALELLASCPAGCSEAVLAAHGFEVKQVVALEALRLGVGGHSASASREIRRLFPGQYG